MQAMTLEELGEPKFADGEALRLVGLSGLYTQETTPEIPKQWDRLNVELDKTGKIVGPTYGVVYRTQPMRYFCGVETSKLEHLPASWEEIDVPAQRYAVFAHRGGVDVIPKVWTGLWMHWMPVHGDTVSDGPAVEFYAEKFGAGDDRFEIWLPLKE